MKTDLEISEDFFDMLKRNGVQIKEGFDEGKEFTIISNNPIHKETLTFCLYKDGTYWRIMGYLGDYFSDEIHKI